MQEYHFIVQTLDKKEYKRKVWAHTQQEAAHVLKMEAWAFGQVEVAPVYITSQTAERL